MCAEPVPRSRFSACCQWLLFLGVCFWAWVVVREGGDLIRDYPPVCGGASNPPPLKAARNDSLSPPHLGRAGTCTFVPPPAAGTWKRFPQRGVVAKPLITHFADALSTAAPENRGEARDALTPRTTDVRIAWSPAPEKTPYARAGSPGPTANPHTPTQHWSFPFVPRRVRGRQHRARPTTRRRSFKPPSGWGSKPPRVGVSATTHPQPLTALSSNPPPAEASANAHPQPPRAEAGTTVHVQPPQV